jgi:hypothetical protein
MRVKTFFKTHYSYLLIIALGILYTIFLSNNPTGDSFSNAYLSISGKDMFMPHHLLYSFLGFLFVKAFSFTGISAIKLLQMTNVLFACGSLLVIRRMFKRIHKEEPLICSAILFCGSCFGFLRFATDNECYIVPLFFTLLTLYYMQTFLIENKISRIIKISICLVVGCLFHQIVIISWLCVFVVLCFNKRKKYIFTFLLLSLIVPIIYYVFSIMINDSFSLVALKDFVLNDYEKGYAQTPIIQQVIMLGSINIIRTFIQVHGYMVNIFHLSPIITIIIISLCFVFFVFGILKLRKIRKRKFTIFHERRFVRLVWWVMITNIGFAFFSNGNSEFMIILPFLITILVAYYFNNLKFLFYFSCAILLWNTSFALIPYHMSSFNNNKEVVAFIHSNKDCVYILSNKPEIENEYLYSYNEAMPTTIYACRLNKNIVDSLKTINKTIITDIYSNENDVVLSRKNMTSNDINILKDYSIEQDEVFAKFSSLMGITKLRKIVIK